MRFWNRARYIFNRRKFERDLEEEVRIHRQMIAANEQRLGASGEEAHHSAARSFGSGTLALEDSRSAWGFVWLESVVQDVRYALRGLVRAPVFAVTVMITIGLALGLNTALFTGFNAYFLSPFAVQDPYSLYTFWWNSKATFGRGLSWNEYQQLRQDNAAFADVVAMRRTMVRANDDTFVGQLVSGNYFSMLGIGPELGRVLIPADAAAPGSSAVIVLSHTAWQAKFGGDATVVGRTVLMRGRRFEIVGVARQGFNGISNAPIDFWAPMTMYGALYGGPDLFGSAHPHPLEVTGRLRPKVTPAQARAMLLATAKHLTASQPDEEKAMSVRLESNATTFPLTLDLLASFAPTFTAFGLVLLLACANVANMMLARAMSRQREIGVRLALGAPRSRLVRQLLTEGFILAIPAAACGYLIAWLGAQFGTRAFLSMLPSEFASRLRVTPIHLDWRVLAFVFAAACVSTLAFALAPALQATHGDIIRATRGDFGGRQRGGRLRDRLVIAQVAICVLLLITTVVLLRDGQRAEAMDTGLDVHNVVEIDTTERGQAMALLSEDRSVESIATVWRTPLYGDLRGIGVSPGNAKSFVVVGYNFVSHEYFDVFHIGLVQGRNFTEEEARSEAPVIIVSEATARKFWPGRDAVGETLRIQPPTSDLRASGEKYPQFISARVIGIARDVISGSIIFGPDRSAIYFPTSAGAPLNHSLLVRVRGNQEIVRRALDTTLASTLPGKIEQITSMQHVLELQYLPFRIFTWISEALGLLALVLTAAGIFGVISYLVAQRSKEMGIRVALGATPRALLRLVLSQSFRMAIIGVAIGTLAALGIGRVLAGQFNDFKGGEVRQALLPNVFDAFAYSISIVVVLAAATCAAWVPARRASKIDPIAALRHD